MPRLNPEQTQAIHACTESLMRLHQAIGSHDMIEVTAQLNQLRFVVHEACQKFGEDPTSMPFIGEFQRVVKARWPSDRWAQLAEAAKESL